MSEVTLELKKVDGVARKNEPNASENIANEMHLDLLIPDIKLIKNIVLTKRPDCWILDIYKSDGDYYIKLSIETPEDTVKSFFKPIFDMWEMNFH